MTMELAIITDYLRAVMGNLAVPYMTSQLSKMKNNDLSVFADKNKQLTMLLNEKPDLVIRDLRRLLTDINTVLTNMIGPYRSNQLITQMKHDLLETGMNT